VIVSVRSFAVTLAALGERARQLRILRNLRQAELAARAGVGVATVHRFEKSGTASLENVLRIATALGAEADFEKLFEAPPYSSLDDALARDEKPTRRNASRRSKRT
jgi:transcriptional regulator with XRE-family HTH domain